MVGDVHLRPDRLLHRQIGDHHPHSRPGPVVRPAGVGRARRDLGRVGDCAGRQRLAQDRADRNGAPGARDQVLHQPCVAHTTRRCDQGTGRDVARLRDARWQQVTDHHVVGHRRPAVAILQGKGHEVAGQHSRVRSGRLGQVQVWRRQHGKGRPIAAAAKGVVVGCHVRHDVAVLSHVAGQESEGERLTRSHPPRPTDLAIRHGSARRRRARNPSHKLYLRGQQVGEHHAARVAVAAVAEDDGVGHLAVVHYVHLRLHALVDREVRHHHADGDLAAVVASVALRQCVGDGGHVGDHAGRQPGADDGGDGDQASVAGRQVFHLPGVADLPRGRNGRPAVVKPHPSQRSWDPVANQHAAGHLGPLVGVGQGEGHGIPRQHLAGGTPLLDDQVRRADDGKSRLTGSISTPVSQLCLVDHEVAIGASVGHDKGEGQRLAHRQRPRPGDRPARLDGARWLLQPAAKGHLCRQRVGQPDVGGVQLAGVADDDRVGDLTVECHVRAGHRRLAQPQVRRPHHAERRPGAATPAGMIILRHVQHHVPIAARVRHHKGKGHRIPRRHRPRPMDDPARLFDRAHGPAPRNPAAKRHARRQRVSEHRPVGVGHALVAQDEGIAYLTVVGDVRVRRDLLAQHQCRRRDHVEGRAVRPAAADMPVRDHVGHQVRIVAVVRDHKGEGQRLTDRHRPRPADHPRLLDRPSGLPTRRPAREIRPGRQPVGQHRLVRIGNTAVAEDQRIGYLTVIGDIDGGRHFFGYRQRRRGDYGERRVVAPTPEAVAEGGRVGDQIAIAAHVGDFEGEGHRLPHLDVSRPGDLVILRGQARAGGLASGDPPGKLHLKRQRVGQGHIPGRAVAAVGHRDRVCHQGMVFDAERGGGRLDQEEIGDHDPHAGLAAVVAGLGVRGCGPDLGRVGKNDR